MTLSDRELISLNRRGLFPGPSEKTGGFLERAKASPAEAKAIPSSLLSLFDAAPDWVLVRQSKKGLLPWEGAATWIEEKEGKLQIAAIQVNPHLPRFLYAPEEIAAHELVHAMRLGFQEERFEEILAHQTSKNRFRRYLGPLFFKPSEAKGFVSLLLGMPLLSLVEIFFDVSLYSEYFFLLPTGILAWFLSRLQRAQKTFARAREQIGKALTEEKALAVLLRLTDEEIAQCAKWTPEEIIAFAGREKEKSLRWRQLFLSYFSSNASV